MTGAAVHPSLAATRARAGRHRVLVVDDEPLMCSGLARVLAGDCDVVTTTSAREALNGLLQGQRYDAILCDVSMPEMSGVDFHGEIARRMPGQAGRVIFMTGGVRERAAAERLDSLPNAVLLKPVEKSVLRWAIGECVREAECASGSLSADGGIAPG